MSNEIDFTHEYYRCASLVLHTLTGTAHTLNKVKIARQNNGSIITMSIHDTSTSVSIDFKSEYSITFPSIEKAGGKPVFY